MARYRTFPFQLPSGNVIEFREPFNADREHVMQFLKENGPSPDELLASHCLLKINGNPLQLPDPRQNMANWAVKDSTAFLTLFMEMFSLSRAEVEDIKVLAKKLQGGFAQPTVQPVSPIQSAPQTLPQMPVQAYSASPVTAAYTPAPVTSPVVEALTQQPATSVGFEDGSDWQIEPSLLGMLEQGSTQAE